MLTRTTSRTVVFAHSFRLPGVDAEQPPGAYAVETDEELIEGLSFPAYRRIATLVFLPANAESGGLAHVVQVDPNDLARAEENDVAQAASRPR